MEGAIFYFPFLKIFFFKKKFQHLGPIWSGFEVTAGTAMRGFFHAVSL